MPVESAALCRKNAGDFEIAFLDQLRVTNRQWFDRIQSEVDLASELASKLTAARSITELEACLQWTTRPFEVIAEDLVDAQNLAETGARLLSGAWLIDCNAETPNASKELLHFVELAIHPAGGRSRPRPKP